MLSTSAIKCPGDFRIFQFAWAICLQKKKKKKKKTAKDSSETFVNYVDNGFGIPHNFDKGYDLVF